MEQDNEYQSLIETENAMFSRYKDLVRMQIQRLQRFPVDSRSRHSATAMLEYTDVTHAEPGINECTQTDTIQSLLDFDGGETLESKTLNIVSCLGFYLEGLSLIQNQWRCGDMLDSSTVTYCAIEQGIWLLLLL